MLFQIPLFFSPDPPNLYILLMTCFFFFPSYSFRHLETTLSTRLVTGRDIIQNVMSAATLYVNLYPSYIYIDVLFSSDLALIFCCFLFFPFVNFLDRFQQILLVLLNIGHILFGSRSIALLTNTMRPQDVAVAKEWRLISPLP